MHFNMCSDVWLELRELFEQLQMLNINGFAPKLRSILVFLRFNNLITSNTFQKIEKNLQLSREWNHLEMNSPIDGTLYIECSVAGTFFFDDMIIYIMQCLLEDPLLLRANKTKDWPGFKQVMHLFFPEKWNDFYDSIKHIENPFFAPNTILWVEKNEHGVFELWQVSHHFELNKKVDMRKKTVVFEGVDPEGVTYLYDTDQIYARTKDLDAFLIYTPATQVKEMYYQVYLCGVAPEVEYYGDEDDILYSFAKNKVTKLGMIDTDNCFDVDYDGMLIVSPPEHRLADFVPYKIDADGVKHKCSLKYVREFLWKRVVGKVRGKNNRTSVPRISDDVCLKKIMEAPYPFSLEEIMKKLEELKKEVYCSKEKYDSMVIFLQDLCKEKGIDPKEDITYLLHKELAEYLSEKIENETKDEEQNQGQIGFFTITKNGEILTDFCNLCEGVVKEKYLVKEKNHRRYNGEVYYDRSTQKYMARYEDILSYEDFKKIEKEIGVCGLIFEEEPEISEDETEDEFEEEDEIQLLEIDWID